MAIRKAYQGREQTYLKHRVLEEYLRPWAHKLGSFARYKPTKLWYVDCFAGPWKSADDELKDTSVAIGLAELRNAANTWREQGGHKVDLGAIFVEKNEKSFAALSKYLQTHSQGIDVVAIPGEFGAAVDQINKRIGAEPAFLFVDPTGWKGAAMNSARRSALRRTATSSHCGRSRRGRRVANRHQIPADRGATWRRGAV
ncbi:MAG TPA: three-Cys-motif partner protein TcmP [Anaeromyxobacter sp.]